MSNVNRSYVMNPVLLSRLHSHANEMRNKYSRLLTFRMDFFYIKGRPLYEQRINDWSYRDMYMLAEWLIDNSNIVGYSWVMELTEQHGIHFHAMFYLNGHLYQKYYPTAQHALQRWLCLTQGQGYVHICDPANNHYQVNGQGILNYQQEHRYEALYYTLSYLAKEEQKDGLYYHGLSDVPAKNGRGRPRSNCY